MTPEYPDETYADLFRLNSDRNFLVDGSNALGFFRIPDLEKTAADIPYMNSERKKDLRIQIINHLYLAVENLTSHFEGIALDDPLFARYWRGSANLVDDANSLNGFHKRLPLGKRFRDENNRRKEELNHCIEYFRHFIVGAPNESKKLPRILGSLSPIRKKLKCERKNNLISIIMEEPLKEEATQAQYAIQTIKNYSSWLKS